MTSVDPILKQDRHLKIETMENPMTAKKKTKVEQNPGRAKMTTGEVYTVAKSLNHRTKSEISEKLREIGVAATESNVLEVCRAHATLRPGNTERIARTARALGVKLDSSRKVAPRNVCTPTKHVRLPGTIAARLSDFKEQSVIDHANFRYGAAGGYSFNVTLTDNPAKVTYYVSIEKNYDTYRGQYKGWAANEDHHCIVVPKQWRTRVLKKGLAELGGLMTLDASPLEGAPEGIELYAAVWAEQGRGFTVNTNDGVIAITADRTASFHGATVKAALSGLRRKLGRTARETGSTDSVIEFVKRHAKLADVVQVTAAQAKEAGACEYGVRSWCNAVGVDYEAGSASLGRVLEGYVARPQVEVRAIVNLAVREYRRELRDGNAVVQDNNRLGSIAA